MNEHKKAVLSCTMVPDKEDSESARIEIRMEGSVNDLLNAFEQITAHLLKQLAEDYGTKAAKALYAKVQTDALKKAGVGFEEDAEAIKKRAALMSILGKTFDLRGEQ